MYFLNSQIPKIDLHGNPRDIARVLVNDFIYDNYLQRIKEVVIIHGRGEGILRKEVHKTLRQNKYVVDFKINNFNIGETIVLLKDKNIKQ